MMGGDVTVTSEPGKGSVFTVSLPGGTAPWPRLRRAGDAARLPLTSFRKKVHYSDSVFPRIGISHEKSEPRSRPLNHRKSDS
jgi:hypothetical protein